MQEKGLDVNVIAKLLGYNNHQCDMCMNVGTAIELSLPDTKYYDGKSLSTRHQAIWMCEVCRDKLVAAISEIAYPREPRKDDYHEN